MNNSEVYVMVETAIKALNPIEPVPNIWSWEVRGDGEIRVHLDSYGKRISRAFLAEHFSMRGHAVEGFVGALHQMLRMARSEELIAPKPLNDRLRANLQQNVEEFYSLLRQAVDYVPIGDAVSGRIADFLQRMHCHRGAQKA